LSLIKVIGEPCKSFFLGNMLEEIVSWRNIEKALLKVEQNKGVCGVDGMQTDELRDYLHTHYSELRANLLNGTFQPQVVKKVEIPKATGGKRMLGIPTVIDRLIQQAISQRLSQLYEIDFSEYSYGFRPNRNAHQAVQQGQKYLDLGYTYLVELDLEKFFDTVNHDRLMSTLIHRVVDNRVLQLIRKYLRSGIMEGGIVSQRLEGTPQGSPLSPLLSNIILDELDRELTRRGHKFVRYADDISIYLRSNKSANRLLDNLTKYIEEKLRLKVNRAKSKVSRPTQSRLLGFSYYKSKGGWLIRITKESIKRVKSKIRSKTQRSSGTNYEQKLKTIHPIITGWVNYFRLATASSIMKDLDSFTRTRLRMGIWKEWKNGKTRIKNLIKLGIPKGKAYEWGHSSKKYCRVAHSPILCRSLDNKFFSGKGYVGFSNYYQSRTSIQIPFF
jgi:RNA-directed DNA polymerase